jgi:hypothetical protein
LNMLGQRKGIPAWIVNHAILLPTGVVQMLSASWP